MECVMNYSTRLPAAEGVDVTPPTIPLWNGLFGRVGGRPCLTVAGLQGARIGLAGPCTEVE
jgi:hypothetical protein